MTRLAPAPAPPPPRLTKKQAAAYIPCSERTLDRLPIAKIRLRGKVLYERSTIDSYLKSQEAE
jgi:hypothetical protein